MSLKVGIVGLPNVGKSTLFNCLSAAKAESANYPFCTIDPNVGIVSVPDRVLDELALIIGSKETIPAMTEFVDIAGIVEGASKGEGLGNKFLHHIREVDAIIHLVRGFENEEIVHVIGGVDPQRDVDVIQTELILADLQTVEKKLAKEKSLSKSGKKEILRSCEILEKLSAHLDSGKPARSLELTKEDFEDVVAPLFLLTGKPVLYVVNSTQSDEDQKYVQVVKAIAERDKSNFLAIDCSLESEIAALPPADQKEYLEAMGLEEPGLNRLIREAFSLMGLMTYYTLGPKEARAWTLKQNSLAPQAAGVIHSDFERGFIRAECYKATDLLELKSEQAIRDKGKLRQEGKDYVVQPGDVLNFKFNV